jgi:hypothetical protein
VFVQVLKKKIKTLELSQKSTISKKENQNFKNLKIQKILNVQKLEVFEKN